MIDTDKYKGHTPAPWVVMNNPDNEKSLIFSVGGLMFVSSANTRLIADAPLLLAEVKRLRMIVAKLEDARIESASMFDRPALFDAVREIYEQRLQDIHQEKREEE